MKIDDQNLEKLFSEALGSNYEVQGKTSWNQLQARRTKTNFFRMNAKSLNIYYVACIVAVVSAGVLVLKSNNQKAKQTPIIISPPIVKSTDTIINSESSIIKNKTLDTKIQKPTIIEKESNKSHKIQEQNSSTIKSEVIIKQDVPKLDSIVESKSEDLSPKIETPIAKTTVVKKVVVVQKTPITVKDTVMNVVKKKIRKRD